MIVMQVSGTEGGFQPSVQVLAHFICPQQIEEARYLTGNPELMLPDWSDALVLTEPISSAMVGKPEVGNTNWECCSLSDKWRLIPHSRLGFGFIASS